MTNIAQQSALNLHSIEIINDGDAIQISWPGQGQSRFHAVWLRDNGQDNKSRDPNNFQKLRTVLDIPLDSQITHASIDEHNQLNLQFSPDQWKTHIDLQWLWQHQYDTDSSDEALISPAHTIWDKELNHNVPTANFEDCKSNPSTLLHWLQSIDRFGVAKMSGLPKRNAVVLDVIDLFGYTRETNYGRYFEIKTQINPINLANTSLGLQVHSDNPYRDPVPTLQFFGCLENDTDGGESIVVDSFKAVSILKESYPEHFQILQQHSAEYDFKGGEDAHLHASRAMIECSPEGRLTGVRFNNRSCHGFTKIPFEKMSKYYAAYRKFAEIIDSDKLQVSFKLQPGELFVVDNTPRITWQKRLLGNWKSLDARSLCG